MFPKSSNQRFHANLEYFKIFALKFFDQFFDQSESIQ